MPVVKTMFAGALGAISPFLLFTLFAEALLPSDLEGIGEGVGILMTLACLPTIIIGAVSGELLVWQIDKTETPAWLFDLLAQSADNRMTYLIAYFTGFFIGPILGLLLVFIYLYSQ